MGSEHTTVVWGKIICSFLMGCLLLAVAVRISYLEIQLASSLPFLLPRFVFVRVYLSFLGRAEICSAIRRRQVGWWDVKRREVGRLAWIFCRVCTLEGFGYLLYCKMTGSYVAAAAEAAAEANGIIFRVLFVTSWVAGEEKRR